MMQRVLASALSGSSRSLSSESIPTASQLIRLFSSQSATPSSSSRASPSTSQAAAPASPSPIYVACVLERLPVVAKPPPAWEAEYEAWQRQRFITRGFLREYPDVKQLLKPKGEGQGDGPSSSSSQPVASTSQPQPAVTSAVEGAGKRDRRSMARALDQRLYLLVKQPLAGLGSAWQFPYAEQQGEESIRETCERALQAAIGRQYPVYFVGNAPMAYVPLLPTGGKLFFMLAQVVDDPWGALTLGTGGKGGAKGGPTDYAWVTREEAVHEYMRDARLAELLPRMLSE